MLTLIECPECGHGMHFAMIDIDGTNLEEGYECENCDYTHFEGGSIAVSRFGEDDEYLLNGVTLTLVNIKRNKSVVDLDGKEETWNNEDIFQWQKDSIEESRSA